MPHTKHVSSIQYLLLAFVKVLSLKGLATALAR